MAMKGRAYKSLELCIRSCHDCAIFPLHFLMTLSAHIKGTYLENGCIIFTIQQFAEGLCIQRRLSSNAKIEEKAKGVYMATFIGKSRLINEAVT